jgi:tetratricopeptide (TPR) repeat protein
MEQNEAWYAQALAIPRPDSLEDLRKLAWEDFELFALLVIATMYRSAGLKFTHTPLSHDGGRDGDAQYVLGVGLDDAFQITFNIWLEVKRRGKEHVGKGDVGSHLVDASLGQANTIIFVTNSKFTGPLNEWLSSYSKRTGVQSKLVNGEDLLALSRKYLQTDEPISAITTVRELRVVRPPLVNATCWFSLSPTDHRTRLSPHPVIARTGRPLYVNVELCVSEHCRSFAGRFRMTSPRLLAADCHPHVPTQAKERLYAPSDVITLTYNLWPGSRRDWSPTDFVLAIEAAGPVTLETTFLNRFDLEYLSIPDVSLTSQGGIDIQLHDHVSARMDAKDCSVALLLAPAGAGKSHIVAKLRRNLAADGFREVYVDCDSVQNDRGIFGKILQELLPLPAVALDTDVREAVVAWCSSLRLSPTASASVADDLCGSTDKSATLTPRDRAELLAMVLGERVAEQPLVLVVEDLHKGAPSVVSLLLELIRALEATGRGNVHFVLSSRPYSSDTSELRDEWLARLGVLSHAKAATVFNLGLPTARDAAVFLSAAVHGIEEHYVDALVDAVGTSPHDLREGLLYLLGQHALRLTSDENAPPLAVVNPARLQRVIRSPQLQQVTDQRLRVLFRNQPDWLEPFLLAGAAYGRSFPLKAAAAAVSVDDSSPAFDVSIAQCGLWSVAAMSTDKADWMEFDHDLIRDTLLRTSAPRTRTRTAAGLYAQLTPAAGDALLARIAYQGGMAATALAHAKVAAQAARNAERFDDVVELNQLSVQILDPNLSSIVVDESPADDVFRMDASIRYAIPGRLPGYSPKDIRKTVLELLVDNLSCLASTGSGSSVLSQKTLSEASALATRLADTLTQARLLSMEGRLRFERDHVEGALAAHVEAEKLFDNLNVGLNRARAENFVRLAICERTRGNVDASIRYLGCAARTCVHGDWPVLNKIRNNLGAIFLKSDWQKVRHHWDKQVAHAERHGLVSRIAHGLLSLGFLDLFQGDLETGFGRTQRGFEIAQNLGIDNQRVRAALNMSVYYVRTAAYQEALDWLRDGEKYALRHHIRRRLWRLVANMAVVYELLGRVDLCAIRERQLIDLINPDAGAAGTAPVRGRQLLPLVNIALRKRNTSDSSEIEMSIPKHARDYAEIVRAGHARDLPNMLGYYCVDLPIGPRFLLTE